jgi:putative aldouronate transport system permease protein
MRNTVNRSSNVAAPGTAPGITTVQRVADRLSTQQRLGNAWDQIKVNWQLYLLLLPTLIYFLVFRYWPMYGVQIAFKDFSGSLGIWDSPWVGFAHFERFFSSYQFWDLLKNTIGLSLFQLIVGFPLPILVALMLHQLTSVRYKRIIQTVIYAPHFISTVVLVGILYVFLSPNSGIINNLIKVLGGQPIAFLSQPDWFRPLYVFSGAWQETGFAAIVYLAALVGVSADLHEAAMIDGASKLQRIIHIDIPSILPTVVVLLVLAVGNVMNVGFEKAFLMQNSLNLGVSEVIQTYVYKIGIQQADYSFAAAVGLFNSIINLILLVLVNRFARRVSGSGLW